MPEDDLRGGLVALLAHSERSAEIVHLTAEGLPAGRQSIEATVEGPFEPLADGRLLLVRRAHGDRPVVAILGTDGVLRDTGVVAYDVAVGGSSAIVLDPVTTLRSGGLADLVGGLPPTGIVPGVAAAIPERLAIDSSGSRLLVTWRADDDRLRWVTLLERGDDGAWRDRSRLELPLGTERALVGWAR